MPPSAGGNRHEGAKSGYRQGRKKKKARRRFAFEKDFQRNNKLKAALSHMADDLVRDDLQKLYGRSPMAYIVPKMPMLWKGKCGSNRRGY
jgi:hypothetical protein